MAKKIKLNNKDNDWSGSGKNDNVWGNGGDDSLSGGGGNDKLRGGNGNDTIRGGGGDDKIWGNAGDDKLLGGAGDDTINATGGGDDVVDGGAGDDILVLEGNFADATVVDNGDYFVITTASGSVRVENVELFRFADGTYTAAEISDKSSFELTTGIDTVVGTDLDDVILSEGNEVTALDDIDGGAGNDTLRAIDDSAGLLTLSPLATVANVEALEILKAGGAINANVSAWTGLTSIDISNLGTAGIVDIDTNGNVTSVMLDGAAAGSSIVDNSATDTVATVDLTNVAGAFNIDSTALTSLSLTTSSTADITTSAAGALAVSVDGGTGYNIDLAANDATSLALTAAGDVSADVQIADATALTISGAGAVTVEVGSDIGDLTSFDASANTGGVTVGQILENGTAFTGGTGDDSVILGATTSAIVMGAGDDTVEVTTSALGTGGSIDGGDGEDTLVMQAADAVTASATATFGGAISNLEALSIQGAVAAAATINMSTLDSMDTITFEDPQTFAFTLAGVAAASTIHIGDAAGAVTVNLAAAGGASDVFTVELEGSGGNTADVTDLIVAGVETLNIVSDDNDLVPGGIQNSITVTDAELSTVVVTGDAGIDLDITSAVALSSVDTSAVANGAVNIELGAIASATAKTVTITGGATDTTVDGSDVVDTDVSLSITTGAGDDTLIGGDGADTLTGGAGADTFVFNADDSEFLLSDTITDFVSGTDLLDFQSFALAAFNYVGEVSGAVSVTAALAGGGGDNVAVLDTANSTLYVDIDASGDVNAGDLVIKLTGVTDLELADFLV